jgi:hypothetical protein
VQVAFPQRPHAISVSASGWDVAGVNEGRLLSGSLELTRRLAPRAGAALESGAEFPAFVRVTREFNLDIDWTLATTMRRLAPARAALSVDVPLVAGESVLTEGVAVKQRAPKRSVLAAWARRSGTRWDSALPQTATLQLALPADAARTKCGFPCQPAMARAVRRLSGGAAGDTSAASGCIQYLPPRRDAQSQRVAAAATPGASFAVDSVEQHVTYGKRSADISLADYRSRQGGRHTLTLPAGARVQTVRVDDEELQLRPVDGRLSLNLLPGEHAVAIRFESPTGAGLRSASPGVDLGAPASNVTTTIELPASRWPLLATPSIAGPVIRYWGELVVFILTALLLGRWSHSPLRAREWLLLGLGLSTLSWAVFALVAAWLFALRWREHWRVERLVRWRFLLVQSALALLTVVAVGAWCSRHPLRLPVRSRHGRRQRRFARQRSRGSMTRSGRHCRDRGLLGAAGSNC